jgi:GMP synthase (glutamine-hydrolysing)
VVSRPFLLLSSRPQPEVVANEHASVAHYLGVDLGDVVQIKMEQAPFLPLDLDDYTAVVLGGSPYNASDPVKDDVQLRVEAELRDLLTDVVRRDFPFLGLCYGVGVLADLLGGTLDASYAEIVGPVVVEVTDAGRDDQLLAGGPATFTAFTGHKECCPQPPAGTVLLASSPTCPVQMFRVGANVYATQFHPELDSVGLATRILAYRNHGYFPPEAADALIEQAQQVDAAGAHRILRRFRELFG